jgi:hypothetical protein
MASNKNVSARRSRLGISRGKLNRDFSKTTPYPLPKLFPKLFPKLCYYLLSYSF